MPLPQFNNPYGDVGATWTPVDSSPYGQVLVELAITPAADMAVVFGFNRMVQEIVRWLYTPPGSDPLNPDYGNPLWTVLGTPWGLGVDAYQQLILQGCDTFITWQAEAFRQGWISQDAMVDHFEQVVVVLGADGVSLNVNMVAVSKTGASGPILARVG